MTQFSRKYFPVKSYDFSHRTMRRCCVSERGSFHSRRNERDEKRFKTTQQTVLKPVNNKPNKHSIHEWIFISSVIFYLFKTAFQSKSGSIAKQAIRCGHIELFSPITSSLIFHFCFFSAIIDSEILASSVWLWKDWVLRRCDVKTTRSTLIIYSRSIAFGFNSIVKVSSFAFAPAAINRPIYAACITFAAQ